MRDHGFTTCQLVSWKMHLWTDENAARIKELCEKYGITISAFWCATVFFGILLPIAPLVMGLVLPHSQKRGYPKYWYALAIAAALWIFFAIIFMFVVGLG